MREVINAFAVTASKAFRALGKRDYETANNIMHEWLLFVACIDSKLDRWCKRICKRSKDPVCACMNTEEYFELVDWATFRCAWGDRDV